MPSYVSCLPHIIYMFAAIEMRHVTLLFQCVFSLTRQPRLLTGIVYRESELHDS